MSQTLRPIYQKSQKFESLIYLPTHPQVTNMISRELPPFEIDKSWIRQDFEAPYNEEKGK